MSEWLVPAHVDRSKVVDFDLFEDRRFAQAESPHAALYALNKEAGCGIYWSPHNRGHWMVTSLELAHEVAKNTELFSSTEMTLPPMPPELEPKLIPLNLDPPEHRRYRLPLTTAFAPRRVAALEGMVRSYAVELIEAVAKGKRCDFVHAIAEPFPIITFMRLMGMDTTRLHEFRTWITDLMSPDESPRARAYQNIRLMMGELIEARLARREDDLISFLLDTPIDGRPPTVEEMHGYAMLLFAAGLDTVANALAFSMSHLASDQALQEQLRTDPSLIPKAVEEFLRLYGVPIPPRTVTRDAEFGGVHLKKGERVALVLPAANLDPEAFPQPYRLDLTRSNSKHVAFNVGPHTCAGRYLARMELRVLLEEWFARMPNVRHDPESTRQYRLGLTLACIKLPLVWD
jgi:cytochrome P450